MSELYRKFGELLKLERKRRGIKLEELSEQLKITEVNLEHIEEGQVTSLPSMIYYNLFAKAYSEALGIDYSRTIEAIKEDIGEPVTSNNIAKDLPPSREKETKSPARAETVEKPGDTGVSVKKLLYIFGGIVVVFVLFIVIYLVFFTSNNAETGQVMRTPNSVATNSVTPARTNETEDEADIDWNMTEYGGPTKMSLRLIPRQQSWSTVLADGDTIIFRNLIPGRIYDVEADYRMIVSVGIPSQVDIELNGQIVDLRDSETGRVSRVEINQLNVNEVLTRAVQTEPKIEPVSQDSAINTGSDRENDDET